VARIKDASVEAVKSTADMVQVVQTRTQLRKAGARWTGRCPFHEEKTPSFSVNAVDKLFYCFGCGKGGDLISFVRETEGLDFAGAIEWLGERFNVPVEYDESSPQAEVERRARDRLLALLEQATAFYERYLWDSAAGEPVRTYLVTRGVSEETAKAFRLGLSPTGSTLSGKAREKGFSPAELAEAGLTNRSGNDRFSGRLMFPLADARGRVVGFSARKLRQDDPLSGKYVNSSEGELFHKSAILYGLHLARPAIAKQDRAVVVEGQMDVIALHQSGLEPVVASMGTALTERQVKELARVTRRLYLCFDADSAGEAATLRGMELARREGFDVRVVALPKGSKDPADDPTGFQALLAEAASYPLHGIRVICDRPGSAQEKFVAAREFLAPIEDSPERQEALRLLADRLDLPKETQAGLSPRGGSRMAPLSPALLAAGERLERDALAGCVAHPKLLPALAKLGPEHFDEELYRRLRAHLLGQSPADEELVPLLAELDARASEASIDELTAEQQLLRLRERQLKRELSSAEDERLPDLRAALDKVRTAFRQLA
jgi:DNA primase